MAAKKTPPGEPLPPYRAKRSADRTPEPFGGEAPAAETPAGAPAEAPAPVTAAGPDWALRLPARAGRGPALLGGAEGPGPRPRGEAHGGGGRGSPGGVRRLRGDHPGRQLRRRAYPFEIHAAPLPPAGEAARIGAVMATAAKVVYSHITKQPGVRGGKACIDDTRISVVDVVAL